MTDQEVRESEVDEEGIVFQIREFDSFRESMRALQEMCDFVPDVSTDDGYKQSKGVAVGGRKIFNALEAARKERKQKVLEEGRLIDSECKTIQDMITVAIGPHLLAYKEVDNRKRKEKEERAQRVQKKIDGINGLLLAAPNMEPDDIYRMIQDLKDEPIGDYGGRTTEVLKAIQNAVSLLEMIGKTKLQEEETARIAHEQEQERLRQEEEDRKRKETEDAKRALDLAEQKRKEEELAERERKLAEQELAARDAELEKEREAQAEKERKEQAEREEQIRKDAAEKARIDAENKAERERVEAEEKAEYDRQQAEAARAKEEALRPDREKLLMFGLGITRQIEAAPVLKQPEVQEALDDVITLLDQAAGICLGEFIQKAGEGEEQAAK